VGRKAGEEGENVDDDKQWLRDVYNYCMRLRAIRVLDQTSDKTFNKGTYLGPDERGERPWVGNHGEEVCVGLGEVDAMQPWTGLAQWQAPLLRDYADQTKIRSEQPAGRVLWSSQAAREGCPRTCA
jgi:hypothetical protein